MHSWPQPQVPSLGDARFDVFNRASNVGTAHSLDDESSNDQLPPFVEKYKERPLKMHPDI